MSIDNINTAPVSNEVNDSRTNISLRGSYSQLVKEIDWALKVAWVLEREELPLKEPIEEVLNRIDTLIDRLENLNSADSLLLSGKLNIVKMAVSNAIKEISKVSKELKNSKLADWNGLEDAYAFMAEEKQRITIKTSNPNGKITEKELKGTDAQVEAVERIIGIMQKVAGIEKVVSNLVEAIQANKQNTTQRLSLLRNTVIDPLAWNNDELWKVLWINNFPDWVNPLYALNLSDVLYALDNLDTDADTGFLEEVKNMGLLEMINAINGSLKVSEDAYNSITKPWQRANFDWINREWNDSTNWPVQTQRNPSKNNTPTTTVTIAGRTIAIPNNNPAQNTATANQAVNKEHITAGMITWNTVDSLYSTRQSWNVTDLDFWKNTILQVNQIIKENLKRLQESSIIARMIKENNWGVDMSGMTIEDFKWMREEHCTLDFWNWNIVEFDNPISALIALTYFAHSFWGLSSENIPAMETVGRAGEKAVETWSTLWEWTKNALLYWTMGTGISVVAWKVWKKVLKITLSPVIWVLEILKKGAGAGIDLFRSEESIKKRKAAKAEKEKAKADAKAKAEAEAEEKAKAKVEAAEAKEKAKVEAAEADAKTAEADAKTAEAEAKTAEAEKAKVEANAQAKKARTDAQAQVNAEAEAEKLKKLTKIKNVDDIAKYIEGGKLTPEQLANQISSMLDSKRLYNSEVVKLLNELKTADQSRVLDIVKEIMWWDINKLKGIKFKDLEKTEMKGLLSLKDIDWKNLDPNKFRDLFYKVNPESYQNLNAVDKANFKAALDSDVNWSGKIAEILGNSNMMEELNNNVISLNWKAIIKPASANWQRKFQALKHISDWNFEHDLSRGLLSDIDSYIWWWFKKFTFRWRKPEKFLRKALK